MEGHDPLDGHPTLETVRTLGKNGSSTVVLARNRANGQLVAVKLFRRGFDKQAAKYLLRELLNHYELTLAKHPHVVSLLDCFLTPRHLAVVLEYVDGENLQVFLEKAGGCIVEALARFLFQQLVIALDFCHRRGKVNRNIRPSSLLLHLGASALPLVKLSDFSVSKDTLRHSQPRSQVGTAMYCAPEVLCNFSGQAYDAAAADVWSVGVVLFSTLFGRHPYARPEDATLPAAQQVIAMFKRVTAPPGSVEGELLVPPVLPTSVLPGAQPGVPLSAAATALLRGLLARDPRVRLRLDVVQQHEWFRTGLPEGAALLNDVVTAEEAAAGPAAVMSPAAAAQLERMVVAAAAGLGSGPGPMLGPVGGGFIASRQQQRQQHEKRTREEEQQPAGPQRHQHPPPPPRPQAHVVGRTVTTATTVSDVRASASTVYVGSPPPSQPASARGTSAGGAEAAAAAEAARATASASAVAASAAAASAVADTAAAVGALWSAFSGESGNAVDAHSDEDDDGLLADLEDLVMGVPEDDLLQAASLDFMLSATLLQQQQGQQQQAQRGPPQRPQQQQQQQPQRTQQQPPQQQPAQTPHQAANGGPGGVPVFSRIGSGREAASGGSSGMPVFTRIGSGRSGNAGCSGAVGMLSDDNSAPISTDTTDACLGATAWPQQQQNAAAWQAPQPLQLQPHAAVPAPVLNTPHAHPQGNGNASAAAGPPTAQHHAAPPPPLFTSLQSITSGAAPQSGGDYAASLLSRLRTDSLPSPHSLAVVDARPFLVNDGDSSEPVGHLSSMLTIPSTYSIDWCTLSARSESLLSPRLRAGLARANGGGGGAGGTGDGVSDMDTAAVGREGGDGDPPPLLLQGSVWHRICHEARGALAGTAQEGRGLRRALTGPGAGASAAAAIGRGEGQ